MSSYFDGRQSMSAKTTDVREVLSVVSRRYMGQNPPHPMALRAYCSRGIIMGPDYRYHADFSALFPEAQVGQAAAAWANLWAEEAGPMRFDVSCLSPMEVHANGRPVFASNYTTERDPDARHRITIDCNAGWNDIVIFSRKTPAGFGWLFGSWLGKHPFYLMIPAGERKNQEGWLYACPLKDFPPVLPGGGLDAEGIRWLPESRWDGAAAAKGRLNRIFGLAPGSTAIARTSCFFSRSGKGRYALKGAHSGPVAVFVDSREVFRSSGSEGKISASLDAEFGDHDVTVECGCGKSDWGFELSIAEDGGNPVSLRTPWPIAGTADAWVYAGPFAKGAVPPLESLGNRYGLLSGVAGQTYWRLDAPDTRVRMYNDNRLFGHWNYPLGVTLYGLIHAGKAVGSQETLDYVASHVRTCIDSFPYALWDKAQYGGATAVHSNLSSIDSLDDCGSFGSLLLEAARELGVEGYREIADYVAQYISEKQERLPDGSFFRKKPMHAFHEQTLWVDDLYMSVPFLCRYYQLTKDVRYIDDAASQFIGFREKLFIPEHNIMSHVYDFKRGAATGVPWGRGNGWALFSLAELLEVLPENHGKRPALLSFFRDLCKGYLALQDEAGMWHQVLTHPDSYPETSCTSMFTYAFSKGVRHGWLPDPAPYAASVFKAWKALTSISIDAGGNIHGVCRGSAYSFSPDYYKKDLTWNLNDTHGIGIVLLAGVEVLRLCGFEAKA